MLCDLIKHKHGYALFIYSSDTTADGTVRLVDGRDKKEGRVQMYYNEKWHSICSDTWSKIDGEADVVCSALGFSRVLGQKCIDTPHYL